MMCEYNYNNYVLRDFIPTFKMIFEPTFRQVSLVFFRVDIKLKVNMVDRW